MKLIWGEVTQAKNHRLGDQLKYLTAILIMCFVLAHNPIVADWTCFKGSPDRRSSSDVPAPDTSHLMWQTYLGSELYASPVVKNGKVFQVAFEEIVCIGCDKGDVLWTSSVPAHNSTPALTDDKIIVATNRGVTALSIKNGTFLWEYVVSGRFSELGLIDYIVSSPAVVDGRVVAGTRPYAFPAVENANEMYMVCLDEDTGREKWYKETTIGVLSSPCITEGRVFAASREMLCIDLERGKVVWNSEHERPYLIGYPIEDRYAFNSSTPALYHGILVAGSSDIEGIKGKPGYVGWKKMVAMDQYTGDVLWEWVEEGFLASSPAVYKGKIYFYSYDGMLRCLSLLDGEELWMTSLSEPQELETPGSLVWPSPAATDGKVYIGSIEGMFYCLDADTGEILWKYETGGPIHSSPAIISGKVLISSTDGSVYCFGIDPEKYKTKAEKYIEEKEYGKAEEFLIKAKEFIETEDEVKEIEELLDFVNDHKKEYQKRQEKIEEAESLMDRADEILWNDQFKEALDLYVKAREIYRELGEKFGESFCEARINYIQEGKDKGFCVGTQLLVALIVVGSLLRRGRGWLTYSNKNLYKRESM